MNNYLLGKEYYEERTVAIVDNDALSLRMLVDLLHEFFPRVEVLWSITSGGDAVLRMRESHRPPDLLILDMSLEGIQGPGICRHIRRMNGTTWILGVTAFNPDMYREELQRAGAQGIVTKLYDMQIVQASARLLNGIWMQGFYSPQQSHDVIVHNDGGNALSVREEEILEYVISYSSKTSEVAQGCGITQSAVRKIFQSICKKLGVADIGHAMLLWVKANRL